MVTLDSRRPGVVVPEQFMNQPTLNLNFDHLFRIPDFSYDEHGVRASLSFGGVDRWCDVPWTAVYFMRSLESQEVMVFPGELPPEMADLVSEFDRAIRVHQQAESDATDSETPPDSGGPEG
jgi:stringent starvation protein B